MQEHRHTSRQIGFGGGCHWCTEAVFLSLLGVAKVEQGWIAADGDSGSFSEAVVVHFNEEAISLGVLIEVHLRTHSSSSSHSMRGKYRSAIYSFDNEQSAVAKACLDGLQSEFEKTLVTRVMQARDFKENVEKYRNYYYSDPNRPFCRTYIDPKLRVLRERFNKYAKPQALLSSE